MHEVKRRALSVAWKLALVPAAIALPLVALVLATSDWLLGRHLEDRARQRVEQTGGQLARQLSSALSRRAADVQLLSRSAELAQGAPAARMRSELHWLQRHTPGFAWLGVTDREGRVLAATGGMLEGSSIAGRPVFREGVQGMWVGDVHPAVALAKLLREPGGRTPELVDIAVPLAGGEAGPRGVLAAHLSWSWFRDLSRQAVGADAGEGLHAVVLSQDGTPLISALAPDDLAALRKALVARAAGAQAVEIQLGGRRHLATLHRAELQPAAPAFAWSVVVLQDLDVALRPVARLQRGAVLGGVLLALVFGVLGYVWSRRLALPYAGLLDAVERRYGESPRHAHGLTGYVDALAARLAKAPADGAPAKRGIDDTLMRLLGDAQRLRAVLDNLPAPVFLLDANLAVQYWNRGCEALFGWRSDEALGRPIDVLLRGDALTADGQAMGARLRTEPGPFEFEAEVLRHDGAPVLARWDARRLPDAPAEPGEPPEPGAPGTPDTPARPGGSIIVQAHDLTAERAARQAESRLRENEASFAAVINAASDAVISTDVDGRIIVFNPAAERIFGHAAETMLGRPLETLLPERHRHHHGGDLARFAGSQVTRRRMGAGRVQGLHAGGGEVELEASISQAVVNGRQMLTAILRDVTDRVRVERALAQYQQELAALTRQLMDQEKLTTRRLAQALHDQLGQTLAALRLAVDALPADIGAQRERIERLADAAIAEVRQVLVELRPPLLEEHGLGAALDNELRARRPLPSGLELQLDVAPAASGRRWPADVEYAAFMIAREAIGNAQRHAGAALVMVSVSGDVANLWLEVTDDGNGIAPEAAAGKPGHLGLVGMRERALAIDASFKLDSVPGEGTWVSLHWQAPTADEEHRGR